MNISRSISCGQSFVSILRASTPHVPVTLRDSLATTTKNKNCATTLLSLAYSPWRILIRLGVFALAYSPWRIRLGVFALAFPGDTACWWISLQHAAQWISLQHAAQSNAAELRVSISLQHAAQSTNKIHFGCRYHGIYSRTQERA